MSVSARSRIRASTVCVDAGEILLVELRDPLTGELRWFPPGGRVESGESPERAAVRETLEETGLEVSLLGPARVDSYPFTWAGVLYHCRTHFFPAALAKGRAPAGSPTDPLVARVGWMAPDRAASVLSFDPNIQASVLAVARPLC